MNTHLHVMEAYTNLLRVWPDAARCARHRRRCSRVTLDHIVDERTGHFRMFFDIRWNSLTDHVSFGHDIEGSWLIYEAAQVLGDAGAARPRAETGRADGPGGPTKRAWTGTAACSMRLTREGVLIDANKHWVAAARSGGGLLQCVINFRRPKEHFLTAALRAWVYIEERIVNRVHGANGYAQADAQGAPLPRSRRKIPARAFGGPVEVPVSQQPRCATR